MLILIKLFLLSFLTSTSSGGYGENVFRRLRDADPEFAFNQDRYKGAEILVVDSNFGCGSSREHAVWALKEAGIKVIIGKSFADIFSSNSAKNGLLLIVLDEQTVEQIIKNAEDGNYQIKVDLEKQSITLADQDNISFEYDAFRKYCLLEGLDDIDYILSEKDVIANFREAQKENRFYSTVEPNHE